MESKLPFIIAGPILRRVTPEQMVLWLVTSSPIDPQIECYEQGSGTLLFQQVANAQTVSSVQIGEHAFVYLLDVSPPEPLPTNVLLEYDLLMGTENGQQKLSSLLPELLYPGESRLSFVVKTDLDQVLHGSCRKPHYSGKDALPRVDEVVEQSINDAEARPALLLMSGDQIYADDVSGPLLVAIHQVIELLGLFPESIQGGSVSDSDALYASEFCYYERESILPHDCADRGVNDVFFGGKRKPIFTSATAHNHLITLAEVLAMYFLVWSPSLWKNIQLQPGNQIKAKDRKLYEEEQAIIEDFVQGLPQVQRMLAHIPTYMIFDDHDITDDWNLTRGWEETAYSHPVSRRIIGNTLIGYWLCQGWGNAPQNFDQELLDMVQRAFQDPGAEEQDRLINHLLEFNHWHYTLDTSPKLVVLNTRTNRWWSENSHAKPSGLMDWEALTELQQELVDEPAVILVSPAPIFGVKLIETVQRIFSYFGHALMVDAENWMAHPGSANVILNIFKNPRTPQNFVILSGDVHYSLAYDIKIRFRKNSPNIWQITCSGFKNEFPHGLLSWFEKLNRWIYGSRSPLNWFTKRRGMIVKARNHSAQNSKHVINQSAVGCLNLNSEGVPTNISVLLNEGGEQQFLEKNRNELIS